MDYRSDLAINRTLHQSVKVMTKTEEHLSSLSFTVAEPNYSREQHQSKTMTNEHESIKIKSNISRTRNLGALSSPGHRACGFSRFRHCTGSALFPGAPEPHATNTVSVADIQSQEMRAWNPAQLLGARNGVKDSSCWRLRRVKTWQEHAPNGHENGARRICRKFARW